MEVKRIAFTLSDASAFLTDGDKQHFKETLGDWKYQRLCNKNYWTDIDCVIRGTGRCKTYTAYDNYQDEDKKKPCEFCGEYSSWYKDYSYVKHSKKNCPYKFILGIENHRALQYCIKICDKAAEKMITHSLNQVAAANQKETELDAKIEQVKKEADDKVAAKQKEYDEKQKELQLFYRIMPQDTINQRLESHNLMMEEQQQKKQEAEAAIVELNEKMVELKKQEDMVELNMEMRNVKLKNLEHKCSCAEQQVKDLTQELKDKDRKIQQDKLSRNAERDGYKHLEELNDKLITKLKEGGSVSGENCSICCCEIVDEEMTLNCGHKFHTRCLTAYWLGKCRENRYKMTYKCPNCRGEAVVIDSY